MTPPAVSVVIPVFDEEESLPRLVGEVRAALDGAAIAFEAVLIDDGSRDGSLGVARRLAAEDRRFRVLRLPRNRGQSAAMGAGFRAARAPVVVTLDADLQNDPADIPRLVAELEGWDVVSGVRAKRRDSLVRRLSSRIANRVRSAILRDGVSDVGCSLKAYRSEYLREVPVFNGMHRFLPALVAMQGARIKEVPVSHRPRVHGVSKYGIGNRLWRGIADLAAVRWLQARWVDLRAVEELDGE